MLAIFHSLIKVTSSKSNLNISGLILVKVCNKSSFKVVKLGIVVGKTFVSF